MDQTTKQTQVEAMLQIIEQTRGILLKPSDTEDVIIDPSTYIGTKYYLIVRDPDDEKIRTSYTFKDADVGYELLHAERGTAYTVLYPIMMAVHQDDTARAQVTRIMEQAYSPLDLLMTQKGVTGDELQPAIAAMNGWELKELHDFVDGMKAALRSMQTTAPSGAETIYPDYVDVPDAYDGDYDDVEADALLSDDYENDYGDDAEDGSFDADDLDTPDETPEAPHETYEIADNKDKSLASKLLSIFKRK